MRTELQNCGPAGRGGFESAGGHRRSGRDDRKLLRASRHFAAGRAAPAKIYWHRELPPVAAEAMGEHAVEAASARVSQETQVWDRCYPTLMSAATSRLQQEIARLGGDCAHVLEEAVETKHDGATGDTWLQGRFTYMLYRLAQPSRT